MVTATTGNRETGTATTGIANDMSSQVGIAMADMGSQANMDSQVGIAMADMGGQTNMNSQVGLTSDAWIVKWD